jgi:hypothetical protein
MAKKLQQFRVAHTGIDVTGGKPGADNLSTTRLEGEILTIDDLPPGEDGRVMLDRLVNLGALVAVRPDELNAEAVSPATGTEGGGEERE